RPAPDSAATPLAGSAAAALGHPPATAPANTAPPTITGQATVGRTLPATAGAWTANPTPTYTYQWKRCDSTGNNCTTITGATQSSYTLATADAGTTLTDRNSTRLNASHANISYAAFSVKTSTASPPVNTALPTPSRQTPVERTL